jgi:hypothetical protein
MNLITWLFELTMPRAEKELRTVCRSRPTLSCDAFFDRYFATTECERDVVASIRSTIEIQLGIRNLLPTDNIARGFPDVGLDNLLFDIAEHFSFTLSTEEVRRLDGTLFSIVCFVQEKIEEQRSIRDCKSAC